MSNTPILLFINTAIITAIAKNTSHHIGVKLIYTSPVMAPKINMSKNWGKYDNCINFIPVMAILSIKLDYKLVINCSNFVA